MVTFGVIVRAFAIHSSQRARSVFCFARSGLLLGPIITELGKDRDAILRQVWTEQRWPCGMNNLSGRFASVRTCRETSWLEAR